VTVNLSTALTVFVILLLIIDVIYRIRFPRPDQNPNQPKHEVIKEFFRDYKDQLSWTRIALTALLVFAIIVVIVGLKWPHLWDKCKETFNAVLEWCKWLYGISKTPEAVNQVGQLVKPKEQA